MSLTRFLFVMDPVFHFFVSCVFLKAQTPSSSSPSSSSSPWWRCSVCVSPSATFWPRLDPSRWTPPTSWASTWPSVGTRGSSAPGIRALSAPSATTTGTSCRSSAVAPPGTAGVSTSSPGWRSPARRRGRGWIPWSVVRRRVHVITVQDLAKQPQTVSTVW